MPATAEPENTIAVVERPLQITWLATVLTAGVGFTVIENVLDAPLHVLDAGVTVINAVTGTLVALVAANEAMVPEPDAASPMDVVVFVQLYVVLATAPENVTAVVLTPLQST